MLETQEAQAIFSVTGRTNYDFLSAIKVNEIKRSTMQKNEFYNYPVAFDIETSSFMENDKPRACMYAWQMCFGDDNLVVTGRSWNEWLLFIRALRKHFHLKKSRILVVYVHNLSYIFKIYRSLSLKIYF